VVPAVEESSFLRACRGATVGRVPVWFMRQAGRSLPEYRALRGSGSILQAIADPALACEATLQPVRRYGVDAAIVFSDIVVPLHAIGFGVDVVPGTGPVVASPVRGPGDLDRIRPLEEDDVAHVAETVRLVAKELAGDGTPLIGLAGAPFTVASYAVEGGSQGFTRLKTMLYAEPKTAHALFDKLTRAAIVQIEEQIAAGAEAAQIFESWLGELDRYDLEEFSFPYLARIAEAVRKKGVPVIFFGTGMGGHLERIAALGFDVVSIDWRMPIEDARARLPGAAVQGNLDSTVLLGPKEAAVDRALRIVKAVVDAVHAFKWK